MSKSRNVYQLKVVLRDIRPPIWRRLLVADTTLDRLAEFVITAMGWHGGHLHGFHIHGEQYGAPDPEWGLDWMLDESRAKMGNVIFPWDKKFIFQYDFGDGWEHDILIEKVLPYDKAEQYPVCLKGKRACPPEDIGGVWGYEEFLEAIRDRNHPRYEELIEWIGGSFDPEEFDLDAVNLDLQEVVRNSR